MSRIQYLEILSDHAHPESRKIKCSGDAPCTECSKHGRRCEYQPISSEESRAERDKRRASRNFREHDEPSGSQLRDVEEMDEMDELE